MSTIADTDLFTTSDTAIPVPVLEDSATLHPHVIVVFGATGDLARRKLLALMAMEPPSSLEPRSVSEEKSKVFGSMQPVDVSQVVRGRYEWYRSIPGVAEDVQTQTLSALECEIDHWWRAGVPFCLRAGKNMAQGARLRAGLAQCGLSGAAPTSPDEESGT